MRAQKCLSPNLLEPTRVKERLLRETYKTFFYIIKEALDHLDGVRSRAELHERTYEKFKDKYRVASQLVIEATSYAWSSRKTINEKPKKCIVRFDRRLFSFKKTKRNNPVLSLRLNRSRVAIPISQDGAHKRLQQHLEDGWRITSIIMKHNLNFLAVISKEVSKPIIRPNVLGVDMNSSKIAVTIICKGKVLKQTYLGQDLSVRQFKFEERRAELKYRDRFSRGKAGLKLKKLSGKQRNYIRTRIWQISNQIVDLAKRFNANIAVERKSPQKA